MSEYENNAPVPAERYRSLFQDYNALRARVEALEGAIANHYANHDHGDRPDKLHDVWHAALAGEPVRGAPERFKLGAYEKSKLDARKSEPPTTCPTCHSTDPVIWRTRDCHDPWHTVPTGTDTPFSSAIRKPGESVDAYAERMKSGVPTGTDHG
jgi:hypothetical protein